MSTENRTKLNIPTKIKVGFQKRPDTYTGQLAYVIYFDEKGKLRKETSWNGWRDKGLMPKEFDNVPTDGFVLNKKVGGGSSGWNHRNTYVRVYDPRGFEFEIQVPNLLFILQECSAIKGKGLEGEFVYSWDGAELVLLPASSQEFKASSDFTSLKTKKVEPKDIIEGHTYLTKTDKEVLYLGKFTWTDRKEDYYNSRVVAQQRHVFVFTKQEERYKGYKPTIREKYWLQTGFTGLAKKTSDCVVPQFAQAYSTLHKEPFVSKAIKIHVERDRRAAECAERASHNTYYSSRYSWLPSPDYYSYRRNDKTPSIKLFIKEGDNIFKGTASICAEQQAICKEYSNLEYTNKAGKDYNDLKANHAAWRYDLNLTSIVAIKDGRVTMLPTSVIKTNLTERQVDELAKTIKIENEQGNKNVLE